jgi:hypothetical protein
MTDRIFQRLGRGFRSFLQTLVTLVVVLFIIAVGELLPPLRAFDAYLRDHPSVEQALLFITAGLAVAGILTLALAQFLPAPRPPAGLTRGEVEDQSPDIEFREDTSEQRGRGRWSIGGGFSGEATFANTKAAWRQGAYRHDRRWRLLFVMMLGALALLLGLFGLFVVIGSPGIKFLMLIALGYTLVRSVWAFMRA